MNSCEKEEYGMNRQEKIDAIVEFLDENSIKIIETTNIQGLIIDAEFIIDEPENEYEHNELIEKGLIEEDLESFKTFLENKQMIMIKIDDVTGVSFDNCELSSDLLYESDLWKD